MDQQPGENKPNDFWDDLRQYCEARKHVRSRLELEKLNESHGLVPLSRVLAEIKKQFGDE